MSFDLKSQMSWRNAIACWMDDIQLAAPCPSGDPDDPNIVRDDEYDGFYSKWESAKTKLIEIGEYLDREVGQLYWTA